MGFAWFVGVALLEKLRSYNHSAYKTILSAKVVKASLFGNITARIQYDYVICEW